MLSLSLKIFPRLLRDQAFTLVLAALVVACGTITAISLFIERIDNTLNDEAASFIAADAKIRGSVDIPKDWITQAQAQGLRTSSFITYRAMTFSDTEMALTQIKAVDDRYPLKGELEVGTASLNQKISVQKGPAKGHAWLAPRLFSALNISPGDTIKVGNASFVAEQKLFKEPDNAQSFFGVEPRVMIHMEDIERTGAVQFGSRIYNSLLLTGADQDIDRFKRNIQALLGEHLQWVSPEDGSLAFNTALERAQGFLLLAGSLSVILASIAIALASHRFAVTQQAQVAILKTLGVTPNNIQLFYIILLIGLSVSGFIIGAAAGWGLHHAILYLLRDLIPSDLATAGHQSLVFGFFTTAIALFAFAAPPLLSLRNVSPMYILREQQGKYRATSVSIIASIVAVATLIFFYSRDIKITAGILLGLLACVLVGAALSRVAFWLMSILQLRTQSFFKLGIANLKKQQSFTSLQIFIFASVTFLLSTLFQIRTDLLGQWQPLVDQTPNHFAFNLFEDELPEFKNQLARLNLQASEFYPMSRGRLIDINDIAIKDKIIPNQTRNDYQRELNLTWAIALGEDNKIEHGIWWQDSDTETLKVSAEASYASGLGLELGDKLRFSIAGKEIVAELSSLRSVKWDSMNPNFYMIFNQPIADDFAANWITSFYLPPEQKSAVTTLSRQFPTVSIIELDQTLNLVKTLVGRIAVAVEFILMLVAVASSLVLLTSVYATLDERLRQSALLRSFGATRRFVQGVFLVEFIGIGMLAGLFASVAAELSLFYIQTKIFKLAYAPNVTMWVLTPLITASVIAVLGYLSTLRATYVPPLQVLRNIQ